MQGCFVSFCRVNVMNKDIMSVMKEIYEEFGLDVHEISFTIQPEVNRLVREIIRLRLLLVLKNKDTQDE